MTPQIRKIEGGWAAVGNGFAVFGKTSDEAREKFRKAEERHKEIMGRTVPLEAGTGNGQREPSSGDL